MYAEEVLGKRVVVQHLLLSEITWGPDIALGARKESLSKPREVGKVEAEATRAPWAR